MLVYTKVSENRVISLCMTQESNFPEEEGDGRTNKRK